MLELFSELDQSYEGFYLCREALQTQLRKRDTNRMLHKALDHGMTIN